MNNRNLRQQNDENNTQPIIRYRLFIKTINTQMKIYKH